MARDGDKNLDLGAGSATPHEGVVKAQLRDAIDRGLTGDKVDAFDPATSPLGTDDEAAGRPDDAEELRRAMREQTGMAKRMRSDPGHAASSYDNASHGSMPVHRHDTGDEDDRQ
ncbi:MAG TPA: hypothetical protein VEH84_11015 [Alphaproteobacteria bacterium]|nr:hypothetical protein [Alphaproteobacteria bacterium]